MNFPEAVQACSALAGGLCAGLHALPRTHRSRILFRSAKACGSLDFDSALRSSFPRNPRWDYVIGVRTKDGDRAVWVEVHPASSLHVDAVMQKKQWSQAWVRQNAPHLDRISSEVYWLATGAVSIRPGTRQMRRLAEAGIRLRGQALRLP